MSVKFSRKVTLEPGLGSTFTGPPHLQNEIVDRARKPSRFFDPNLPPREQLLASWRTICRISTDPVEITALTLSLPEGLQAEAFDWPAGVSRNRVWLLRRPMPSRTRRPRGLSLQTARMWPSRGHTKNRDHR
jgi:3D-(3,5/4)-trihydroxycyclohexane-1,2-dione acylhydrolase (decyclizing)